MIFSGQTVIIAPNGDVPKWLKGADSKSARRRKACGGSNPSISARNPTPQRVGFFLKSGCWNMARSRVFTKYKDRWRHQYLHLFSLHIHRRIHTVHILLIQLLSKQLYSFAKPLEMHDFPFTKELDYIIHIRIVTEPQDVIIGDPRFLFSGQILHKIRHGIALDSHTGRVPWTAGGGGGIHTDGVVNEIGCETSLFDLAVVQIPRQLMHDRTDHFQVSQFFCTCI